MVQSVLNYYCLTSKSCCFCVSLKTGTILIALAGFVPCIGLIYAFVAGKEMLVEYGVHPLVTDVILHLYAVLGVLLGALNVILIVASITYNEKQILLYLWFACVYFFLDFGSLLVISISAILYGNYAFGFSIFFLETSYWIFLYVYIFPVINGFRKNIHTIVIVLQ